MINLYLLIRLYNLKVKTLSLVIFYSFVDFYDILFFLGNFKHFYILVLGIDRYLY